MGGLVVFILLPPTKNFFFASPMSRSYQCSSVKNNYPGTKP